LSSIFNFFSCLAGAGAATSLASFFSVLKTSLPLNAGGSYLLCSLNAKEGFEELTI